ncbi:MAG: UDP-3-O-(3-hydroxymyristoyl)glucosamine N-acyltransferase, partial [Bdellovibrionaceae bacterium]|nr:UDP-3-O-(3-hydroxymyristoyl)glucosamine N-acyltransferase [Pseudobdellovibrionaceae bacterium]
SPYTDPVIENIHPAAIIHPSARLGAGVRVGPHAVVSAECTIGHNVFIGANAVIEAGSKIGDDSVIHPLVYVGHHTRIGARCEILPNTTLGKEGFGYAHDEKGNHYRIPHQGCVVIDDDVHIGANCSIDRATFGETRIGAGTKLDNQVHIAHNCRIGRNCLLTAKFAIAGSSTIGDMFVAGGSSTVTGHIEISHGVQLAGMSTVTKDITSPGQYGGFPLVPLQDHLKIRAAMVQLPAMRKQLSQLMKKIFPEGSSET